MLFTIFKRYLLENGVGPDHIIEIALDGIENEELRDSKMCFKYIKDAMKDDEKYYLLLDEVQFMSRFEEVLNSLLRMSNIDVYVSGSNSSSLYVCDREKNKKSVGKQRYMCWLWCLCEKVSCRSNTDERRTSSLEIGRM